MSEAMPSLLIERERRSAEQPALFSFPEDEQFRLNQEGIYTAERLFRDRPDTYRSLVELLTQGVGVRAMKKVCRVHHNTIAAVAAREQIAIDTGKEKLLGDLRLVSSLLADSLIEAVLEGRLKPEAMPIALGIAIDKTELLSGGVTARIETVQTEGPKSWEEWKERMLKQATGREITGSGGEEDGQRAVEAPVRIHTLPMPAADVQSDAAPTKSASATGGATEPTTSEPSDLAGEEGGRGSASEAGGGRETTG